MTLVHTHARVTVHGHSRNWPALHQHELCGSQKFINHAILFTLTALSLHTRKPTLHVDSFESISAQMLSMDRSMGHHIL